MQSLEEANELHDELVDRFGDLPDAVHNLLRAARLKVYGAQYAIETITQKGLDYELRLHADQTGNLNEAEWAKLQQEFENRVRLVSGPNMVIETKGKGLTPEQSIDLLERFLVQYKRALKSKGELQNAAK